MNNNEKLESIIRMVSELGLSGDEVMSYLAERGNLNSNNSTGSSQTADFSQYRTPSRVLPGMFVYTDGLIYPDIIEGRQIKAVVGYIDGSEGLAVCLQEKYRSWHIGVQGEQSAYMCCRDYAEDGVKPGEAFLASVEQLQQIAPYHDVINASLNLLKKTPITNHVYWSSDGQMLASMACEATAVYLGCDGSTWTYKGEECYNILRVRPVIKI